jgi:hypothetical protein
MDAQEREQSRIIDELADLDDQGLAEHLQNITDDVKFDIRSGNGDDLWTYQNRLVAIGRVFYAISHR